MQFKLFSLKSLKILTTVFFTMMCYHHAAVRGSIPRSNSTQSELAAVLARPTPQSARDQIAAAFAVVRI